MALSSDVGELQDQVFAELTLNGEVVLLGILRTRIFCCLAEEQNGAEDLPVHWLAARRIENAVEGIWKSSGRPILSLEGCIEQCVEDEGAAAEGWLRAELFENQLLDRVVEDAIAGTNAGLSRAAEQLAHEAVLGTRAP